MSDAAPLGAQLKRHKTELLVGAAGLVVAVALYSRSKAKSTSGAPAVTPGGYYPSSGAVGGTATTYGTDALTGMENQILGLQQAALASSAAGAGAPAAPASVPALSYSGTSSAPPTPAPSGWSAKGPRSITITGSSYDVLGQVTPNPKALGTVASEITWEVSGGAPVMFGNAVSGPPTQGLPTTGAKVYAYTPAKYASSIFANPSKAP